MATVPLESLSKPEIIDRRAGEVPTPADNPPPGAIEAACRELRELRDEDAESAHIEADRVLCAALRGLGAAAVADEFIQLKRRVGFYYA